MFFKESDQLQQAHPTLKPVIEGIDAQLSHFDEAALADPSIFASLLQADKAQIIALFNEYVDKGILIAYHQHECRACSHLMPAVHYRASVATGDEQPCPNCGSNLTSQEMRQVNAYRLSTQALRVVARHNAQQPKQKVDHLVLLIHGILTDAEWQEKVQAELNTLPGVEAQPIGYGLVELFQFWCPFFTRTIAIKTIERKIRHAISLFPGAKVSVIAHSFGTYSIFRILNEANDIRLKSVVLCGSIVSHKYPWDKVQPRIETTIINDCGTRDPWPAAAKSLTWGYGATGIVGFKSAAIRDRFHDFSHSGFFDDKFITKYWVPFIERGEIVSSPWTIQRPNSPFHIKLLSNIPFQWILLFSLLITFGDTIRGFLRWLASFI